MDSAVADVNIKWSAIHLVSTIIMYLYNTLCKTFYSQI